MTGVEVKVEKPAEFAVEVKENRHPCCRVVDAVAAVDAETGEEVILIGPFVSVEEAEAFMEMLRLEEPELW